MKVTLRRPMHRWEDNIKRDLMETGFGSMYLIHLSQDRDWWWAETLGSIKCREFD
jgi:hypothetical protein